MNANTDGTLVFNTDGPAVSVPRSPQTQKHPEYTGPSLGPKMADSNKREFTDAQLRAHEGELNLQMGYNKGASQAGHGGMGNTRHM